MHGEVEERLFFDCFDIFKCSPSELVDAHAGDTTVVTAYRFEHSLRFLCVFLFLMACRYVVISISYVHTTGFQLMRATWCLALVLCTTCVNVGFVKRTTGVLCKWIFKCD